MTAATSHRLDGLEPDNLLAFLSLLGLLRALEKSDATLHPRAAWDIDTPPLRPRLFLARELSQDDVAKTAAKGVGNLAEAHDFGNLAKLKVSRDEARKILEEVALGSSQKDRRKADLWSALVSDAVVKEKFVERTPLCLLDVAQTNFLKAMASVCNPESLPKRNRKRVVASDIIADATFRQWQRKDDTPSFRWDPFEDSRHAYRWAAPADDRQGVEHGANMLAAIGLAVLTLVPEFRAGRVRPSVIGGTSGADGFSFAWPIWREPATLSAIRALLAHPDLRELGGLAHLGVDHVLIARRVPNGKYMNFARARPLSSIERSHAGR
jgi:hypothetical protein